MIAVYSGMEASVLNCTGTCTLPGKLITFQGKHFTVIA